ncbi:MAG: hypothetical protein AAGG46_04165, partial [Planctomycetota bacterium]
VDVSLSGATQIEVLPGSASDGIDLSNAEAVKTAKVKLVFGRLILANTGSEPATIELAVGGVDGAIEMGRGSVLTVEARRPFQAGVDPTLGEAPLVATYYTPQGGFRWLLEQGDVIANERSAWSQLGEQIGPAPPDEAQVEWLDGEGLSVLQSRAAAELERKLEPAEPIWPQLAELYDVRRVEEQAQVAICSMYVGHYDPFIKALSDQGQQQYWSREIEAIRATMSGSPELAKAVRAALIDFRGEEYAADLYRMLCGFSTGEIGQSVADQQRGVLVELIDWLESDQLDFRVLANHNLEQITNRRVYNPAASPDRRRRTVAVFRDRLADGELVRPDR